MTVNWIIPASLASLLVCCLTAHAETKPSDADLEFFESKIRPALVKHCYECHSDESGKAKGGLKVDSLERLLAGGDSGPAIVTGSPAKSLLYEVILYGDDSYQMPPKGKLPQNVIEDIRKWIEIGAPDPRMTKIGPAIQAEIDIQAGREFWAYQPIEHQAPPRNDEWARTSIDQYVIAQLEKRGLQPVEDADNQTVIRRLYFVITGLPPSADDMQSWNAKLELNQSDSSRQEVLTELVDHLLASPNYGERWGRHWLDVARFAESTGGDHNNIYQHAWRYRDYVIDSFNSDKPFDRFIKEQIAGDLLPIADDAEWAENLVATGFLAVGVKLVGEEDQQKYFADLVDEQIDTTTRAFLATTVACARCHDHKFDPIPQEDYYALAGIFRSTETHYGLIKAQARQATTLLDLTGLGLPPGNPRLSREKYTELVEQRDAAAQAVEDAMKRIRSGENVFRGMLRRLRSDRDETEAALQAYSQTGAPRVFAMGTQDRDYPLPTRLLVRGEIDRPAQLVPRGVLEVLSSPGQHELPSNLKGSGRLELANWIANEKNPLTARVIANRVWHWMYGRGLVRTVDDFGRSGEEPSHPELLDHLAEQLIENNWSIKSLIREIALSRSWQLSSRYDESNFAVDPENRFLWRMNPRRLEGEAIRDALLAVSGQLELERPVGTYLREVGEGGVGQNVFEPVIRQIDSKARSVYLPRVRSILPEFLEAFDAPDAGLVTGAREVTSSSLQALYLLNNPFVQNQAEALAERLRRVPRDRQVETAYQMVFSREPTPDEAQYGLVYLAADNSAPKDRRGASASETDSMSRLAAYCQALLCTMEFQMID